MALTKITSAIITDSAITADKLAATLDLTGKTLTVATATAGDNDTTVASTAFVSTAIANLADSAPATLDTLNELAAALGDDANFSTTVTNSIALKAPLAGPTFTGNVGIGDTSPIAKLTVKAASDTIRAESLATDAKNITMSYHDSNDQGQIFCGQDGVVDKNIVLRGHTLIFQRNGGTEAMRIDSSGDVRLAANATGAALIKGVSGNQTNRNVGGYPQFTFVGNEGTGMRRPVTNVLAFDTSGDESMRIDSSGRILIGTTSSSGSSVRLEAHDATNPIIQVKDTTSNIICGIQAGNSAAVIRCPQNSPLVFNVGSGEEERMRIDSSGNVGIGETSPDFSGFGSNGGGLELDDVGSSFTAVKVSQGSTGNLYLASTSGAGYLWQHSNSPLIIGTNNAERIRIQDGTGRTGINSPGITYSSSEKLSLYNDSFGFGIKTTGTCAGMWNTSTSGTYIAFAYGGSGAAAGAITFSGASTSYTSASDYRLKENVDYTWDATTRLKQLKPCRFNWIEDSTNTLVDGFLAHEVSSIVPEAVTGEKDAVYTAEEAQESPSTEEGDVKTQALDNAKLIPLLVKAIQELEARITTLEG
jgi:hypothetical protein